MRFQSGKNSKCDFRLKSASIWTIFYSYCCEILWLFFILSVSRQCFENTFGEKGGQRHLLLRGRQRNRKACAKKCGRRSGIPSHSWGRWRKYILQTIWLLTVSRNHFLATQIRLIFTDWTHFFAKLDCKLATGASMWKNPSK